MAARTGASRGSGGYHVGRVWLSGGERRPEAQHLGALASRRHCVLGRVSLRCPSRRSGRRVAKFNASHPNIHVTFIIKGASKHGLAAFEAGTSPNVAMISSYALALMVQAGAVLKLKPYIGGPDGLSAKQIHEWFYPVVWQDMQTGRVV